MQDHKKMELSNIRGVSIGLPSPCHIWQTELKVERFIKNSLAQCGEEGMAEPLSLWWQEHVVEAVHITQEQRAQSPRNQRQIPPSKATQALPPKWSMASRNRITS